jgi:uncharacterized membrane protein
MRIPVVVALALFGLACRTDAPMAPQHMSAVPTALPQVLPAGAYSMKLLFPSASFSEIAAVNDAGSMVGTVDQDAFIYDLRGSVTLLPKARGNLARAMAVTTTGAIAGNVLLPQSNGAYLQYGAYWRDRFRRPLLSPREASVRDVNDRGEVVGDYYPFSAFYWETATGAFVTLPLPPGANGVVATSINNDRVIVGISDIGGVIWRRGPRGFEATLLNNIFPEAIDFGSIVVGRSGNWAEPAWGKPDYAASFAQNGGAFGISSNHLVAGGTQGQAFVADLGGGLTMLPTNGALGSKGFGVNSCGLVVGASWVLGANSRATYWDPGC